jgi:hypothetical protein
MPEREIPTFSKLAEDLIGSLRRIPNEEPASMRRRPTQELSQLIGDLRVKHSIGMESPEQMIRDHWTEVVGHANASYSHASQIDPRGRLIVLAAHSIVRNELFLHRKAIVEKLQKLPGCAHVKELYLRAG